MNTQTPKRVAFEEVTHALAEIDQYNISKKFEHLERADSALALARNEDSDYVDALLYSGMVCDLLGKAADAAPFFKESSMKAKSRICGSKRFSISRFRIITNTTMKTSRGPRSTF